MELYTVRPLENKNSILCRKFNIAIGCSLGNKWFTPKNVKEMAIWALEHTKEKVCIYVADSIYGINLSVRRKIPLEKARSKSLKLGEEFIKRIKEELQSSLSKEDLRRIDFCNWKEVETKENNKHVNYLYEFNNKNTLFHKKITDFVREHISMEQRKFTEKEIEKLGTYILEEIPETMNIVPLKGIYYEAWAYPFDGELIEFIEKLQNKEVFPEIAENILKNKKTFIQINY